MKKLKTVLILLLALLLSLGLFACGGGKDDNPGGDGDQNQDNPNDPDNPDNPGGDESDYADFVLSKSVINLTDSDDDAALQSKLGEVEVTLRDFDSNETEVSLDQCNYDLSVVKVHEVGEYKVEFSIKDLSVLRNSRTLTVIIEHDWKAEGDIDVCQHDGARRETTDEDVVIHYGTFHDGIYPRDYDTAKAAAGWEEADAYTNKNTATSSIKKFGEVNGKEVPTLTAGQLEQGMTITISGKVKTTVGDDQTGAGSPWGTAGVQKYYNSPSLGVADRFNHNDVQNGYPYGVSVIVREEGWVLYNGISGSGANRLLAGITGSDAEDIGTWRNYGSHVDAADPFTPGTSAESGGYTHGSIPTNWDNVQNWWVYSEGTTMSSGTYYLDWMNYEYSWNYRDDGVIEITYKAWGTTQTIADATTLKAYIKVPDSTSGYYDTIIHGDYNDMTIEKTVTITKNTPKDNGFVYHELADDAKLVYAENTQFDASLLNVTVKYEQSPDKDTPLKVTNGQVYYYVGELTRDRLNAAENSAELKSLDSSKWKSLDQNLLTLNGDKQYLYKIQLTKGGKEWTYLLPDGEITVKPNSVVTATGSDVTIANELFANNGKLGELAFSFDGANVVFTLATGYAQPMSAEQKAELGVGDGYFYVALRLDKAELGADFNAEAIEAKMGNDDVTVKAVTAATYEGLNDLYLVLALNKAGSVTLTGVQTTPIVLDLTALKGFEITSTITGADGLLLNKGGDITLTYQLPAGTKADDIAFVTSRGVTRINAALQGSYNDNGDLVPYSPTNPYDAGNSKVTGFTYVEATGLLTINASVPAANLANYAPLTYEVDLYKNGSLADSLVDTINYKMELGTVNGYVAGENGYYAYVTESGKLNVVWATGTDKLADGKIGGSFQININNGDLDSFKKNGLTSVTYKVENGRLVLVNAPAYVTGAVTLVGTYGNDRDKDAGAFVVFTVDVATGLEITGDYYVEFVGGVFDPTTAPTTLNKVSGTTLTTVTLDNTYKTEIVSTADGNCYEEGLYGWQVSKDNTVLCFANVASAGGDHIDADGNKVCDLCGGKTTPDVVMKDWADGYTGAAYDLTEGDIVDATGSIKTSGISDVGGNFGPFVSITMSNGNGGTKRYWLRTDGCNIEHPNDDWNAATACYPANVEALGADIPDEDFYTSLNYNTLNGAQTVDGTAIDTATLGEYLAGKSFRYVVSFIGTTVKVEFNYFNANGTRSISYYVEIRNVTARTVTAHFISDEATFLQNDAKITVTRASAANSVIDKIESATVGTHEAPEMIEYTTGASNGYVNVNLSGFAETEGTNNDEFYASFKITFSSALVSSTSVKLVDAEGEELGTATLAADKKSVEVYLPIADGLKAAYLDFTNYEASTKQADIKIDLTDLVVSDVTATLGTDNRNINGGTIVITYTNVQGTDTLTIGDVSKTLAELATETALGSDYKAQATLASGTATVTLTAPAADLTKVLGEVEVRLARGEDLIARDFLPAAVAIPAEPNGTELDSTGWYVRANGTRLILFSQNGDTLNLNVNAGEKTAKDHIRIYNLSLVGNAFENANSFLARASKLVISKGGEKTLYVVVIDLTSFGVEAETPYGYQSGDTQYYTVAADRTITKATVAATGEKTQLLTGSCTSDDLKAYVTDGKDFYYNVEFKASEGHKFEAKADASADDLKGYDTMEVCSVCQAVRYAQSDLTQSWGNKSAWEGGDSGYINIGVVHKGGSYEITGTLESNGANNWDLMTPGINSVGPEEDETTGALGLRIDHWVMNQAGGGMPAYPGGQPEANPGMVYIVHNNKTNADVSYDSVADALRKAYNGATVTYTFDYLNESMFIIACRVVKGDVDVTVTFTLTGTLLETYYVFLHPDGCKYTASSVTTVVPKDKTVSTPRTKHQHAYDSTTHRCPTDGALDPAHTTHEYSDTTGKCACGAINPAHTHVYENGICKLCESVQSAEALTGWTDVNKTVAAPNGWDSQNGQLTEKLTKGGKLYVAGSITQDYENHKNNGANAPYYSMVLEFAEGYTFTIWNNGWVFPDDAAAAANFGANAHTLTRMTVYDNGHEEVEGLASEANMMDIAKACNYVVEFDWTQEGKVVITARLSANDRTYVISYDLKVLNADLTALTARIGGDHCDSVVISKDLVVSPTAAD